MSTTTALATSAATIMNATNGACGRAPEETGVDMAARVLVAHAERYSLPGVFPAIPDRATVLAWDGPADRTAGS
jgi:hypothetical protein